MIRDFYPFLQLLIVPEMIPEARDIKVYDLQGVIDHVHHDMRDPAVLKGLEEMSAPKENSIPIFLSTDNNYSVPAYITLYSLIFNYAERRTSASTS